MLAEILSAGFFLSFLNFLLYLTVEIFMDLLDEFKNFCRDKGKYNIIDFKEILELYNQFEEERRQTDNSNKLKSGETEDEN